MYRKQETDAVFLWVSPNNPQIPLSLAAIRYRDNGELQLAVELLLRNAPWIRKVWVVADDLCLQDGPPHNLVAKYGARVTLVPHSDILPPEIRPNFNSVSISWHLDKIQGLSEAFLYLNDDFFVVRPVAESDFFDHQGRPILRPVDPTAVKLNYGSLVKSDSLSLTRINSATAAKRLWGTSAFLPRHTPYPFLKSELESTRLGVLRLGYSTSSRQRSSKDLVPEIVLSAKQNLNSPARVKFGTNDYLYAKAGRISAFALVLLVRIRTGTKFFCLNEAEPMGFRGFTRLQLKLLKWLLCKNPSSHSAPL
jgi:hypothetical protein